MILLIDNYDSFTYNLYQLIGQFTQDIKVIKNDELTVTEIKALHPQAIILSPGPGNPDDSGISLEVVHKLHGKVPMLGVCMGMQVMVQALGGKIIPAKHLMHGKTSELNFVGTSQLFKNYQGPRTVARYHSLVCDRNTLPDIFNVTATAKNHEIMAAEIPDLRLYGVQFHPESILTDPEFGEKIISNFFETV